MALACSKHKLEALMKRLIKCAEQHKFYETEQVSLRQFKFSLNVTASRKGNLSRHSRPYAAIPTELLLLGLIERTFFTTQQIVSQLLKEDNAIERLISMTWRQTNRWKVKAKPEQARRLVHNNEKRLLKVATIKDDCPILQQPKKGFRTLKTRANDKI